MPPTMPPARCLIGRCNNHATHSGRCDDHYIPWEVKSARNTGTTSTERARFRAAVLKRDPVCVHCHKAPSQEADHIIPVALGGSRTDIANGQGLCVPCHEAKTKQEARDRNRRRVMAAKLKNL